MLPLERDDTAISRERYTWVAACLDDRQRLIAEVGVGLGFGAEILSDHGHWIVGIDISDTLTAEHQDLPVIICNAEANTFRGFDTVVCLEVISHMIDPYSWLKRLEVPELIVSMPTTPSKAIYPWRKHEIPEAMLREMIEPKWQIKSEFAQNRYQTGVPCYLTIHARAE